MERQQQQPWRNSAAVAAYGGGGRRRTGGAWTFGRADWKREAGGWPAGAGGSCDGGAGAVVLGWLRWMGGGTWVAADGAAAARRHDTPQGCVRGNDQAHGTWTAVSYVGGEG